MRPERPARKVFFLSAREDAPWCEALSQVRLPGERVALAVERPEEPTSHEPAEWGRMQSALASADAVVVVLSPELEASGFMGTAPHPLRSELGRVTERGGAVLLVVGARCGLVAWTEFDLLSGRFYPPLRELRGVAREGFTAMVRAELVASVEPVPDVGADVRLQEYKLLVQGAQHLADRRQDAAQLYLAIHAAMTAAAGYLVRDLAFRGWRLVVATAPLFVAGLAATEVWRRVLRRYERQIDWRYRQLRRMELQGLEGGYRYVNREWAALYRPRAGRGLTGLEAWIPWIFTGLYLGGFALAVAVASGILRLPR